MCKLQLTAKKEIMTKELISELQRINKRMAKDKARKEELEAELIKAIGHTKDGQTSYELNDKKITIKTPFTWKLDKARFEELRDQVPSDWVRVENKYTPVKRIIDAINEHGTPDEQLLLSEFATQAQGKPSVSISDNI